MNYISYLFDSGEILLRNSQAEGNGDKQYKSEFKRINENFQKE